MNETLAEKTARPSFPVVTSEPELESRAMKNKQTETKSRSGFDLTRHLISGVLCLAVISLICSSASAQNLFVSDFDFQGNYGIIDEFTPNGVRSTFASGLNDPAGLAFDQAGNLFVAVAGSGAIYKFAPAGVRTIFASGLLLPDRVGLAFDSAGNLFVAADVTIYKFTPTGARTTFATVQNGANGLAFDPAGNLFVAAGVFELLNPNTGLVYKFTPTGVRTTFASGLNYPFALAFDSRGNLFVADGGYDGFDFPVLGAAVYKFTPSGLRSTVASENDQVSVIPYGLAIDSADNLFVADQVSGNILKFTPGGVRSVFAPGGDEYGLAFGKPSVRPPTDFNNDGKPDFVLYNASTHQTALWYLNNNVLIGHSFGPTPWPGWSIAGVADFNLDGHPDYLLFNPNTRQTAIWYLKRVWRTLISTVIQITFYSIPIRGRR